jgi:hypothetical protein
MVQETAVQSTDLPKSGIPTLDPTLATLQLAVYPPETRIGDPGLDTIIDAVLSHDIGALRNLTRYTTLGFAVPIQMGWEAHQNVNQAKMKIHW